MKREIFYYELSDAWRNTISEVNVTIDDEDDNKETEILCFYYDIRSGTKKGFAANTDSFRKIVDASVTDKISEIINQYTDIIDIEKVEFPFVIDGVCNDFVFGFADGTSKEIHGFNMWAFTKNRNVKKEPVKAKRILELFKKVSEILIACGVDEKYLSLGI